MLFAMQSSPRHLKNHCVLITGASSGFGAATALAFAREGASLFLGARRMEKLSAVAEASLAAGASQVWQHSLDVRDPKSVSEFMSGVSKETEVLDVLVNNAGLALGLAPVEDDDERYWIQMMETNVVGLLRMTRDCIPLLKMSVAGSLINIGSIAGRVAYEKGAAYCASKAAELQITKALRLELNGTGIRVSTIDPGMAKTEFSMVRFEGDQAKSDSVYRGAIPLSAEDVAETILWVASRPAHVCIDELLLMPTDQAAPYKVHRRS